MKRVNDVVVVGGGISGLCTAYELQKLGYEVELVEKDRVGGSVKTVKDPKGFLYELGPQTILSDEELLNYLKQLGLKPIEASPAAKNRFVYKKGRFIPLPSSPVKFLTSPLLSWRGKLEVFKDLFQRPVVEEISVAQFVRRHFGEEFLNYVVAPFLSGVYAGDPERLSLVHATPKLYRLQRKYGSLIKAFLKERRVAPKGKLISFSGGLKELVEAFKSRLKVKEGKGALRIRKFKDRFAVELMGERVEGRAVVLACPAYAAAGLLRELVPEAVKELEKVYYPPLAVAALSVEGELPEGFGVLFPAVEGRRILGVMFSSKLFPGRAPEGRELLTVFLGGATNPFVDRLTNEQIAAVAAEEVEELFGVKNLEVLKVHLWRRSIPQYNLGYGSVLETVSEVEKRVPGLFFTGNWIGGVSTADALRRGPEVARKVADFLG
ncbi:MAG: protoporphyrinogen oxidase [Aquificae bacterium]|nr:protoporphyrinogen oxidase [Aquificota bacterium]